MITKKELEQLESIYKEQEDLKERIEKLESIQPKIVQDSVRGTSKHFPYIAHTTIIEGLEEGSAYRKRKKRLQRLRKMFYENKNKIDKYIEYIEYELKKINDSEIRRIIRYKYEDNFSWIQIMFKMNYNSEDVARKKLYRYLEKNN